MLLASVALGAPGIVNGTPVEGGHDNVVALARSIAGVADPFCTGTQIGAEWVLTAAHCLAGIADPSGYVLYGDDLVADGYADAVPWLELHVDPDYDPVTYTHDCGLVRLAEPRPDIEPMPLDASSMDDAGWEGQDLVFYGFGVTSPDLDETGVKRWTTLPIRAVADVVFTLADGTDVCFGDSGGPGVWRSRRAELEPLLVGLTDKEREHQRPVPSELAAVAHSVMQAATAKPGAPDLCPDFDPALIADRLERAARLAPVLNQLESLSRLAGDSRSTWLAEAYGSLLALYRVAKALAIGDASWVPLARPLAELFAARRTSKKKRKAAS